MTEKEYAELVKDMMPRSPVGKDCFHAFWIGGLICAIGQFLMNRYLSLGLEQDMAGTASSMTALRRMSLSVTMVCVPLCVNIGVRSFQDDTGCTRRSSQPYRISFQIW